MNSARKKTLNLRAGEFIEVLSESEILRTLDADGRLEGLPFMPEMLKYCGQRYRVFKSAHKTCDTIGKSGIRRMNQAVHLEGLRCDGEFHGGCQAGCLLFWKEAWLKRSSERSNLRLANGEGCGRDTLFKKTASTTRENDTDEQIFSCQATELNRATLPMSSWDIRQYVRDVVSQNVSLVELARVTVLALFNMFQRARGGSQFPRFNPQLPVNKTPRVTLDLKAGDLVEVKSKEEIEQTIGADSRNRGLWFDVEMLRFCNRRFRVLHRVERIIDEKSGRMLRISSDCLILENVTCSGEHSYKRRFCPRAVYPYWREIWLRRLDSC